MVYYELWVDTVRTPNPHIKTEHIANCYISIVSVLIFLKDIRKFDGYRMNFGRFDLGETK